MKEEPEQSEAEVGCCGNVACERDGANWVTMGLMIVWFGVTLMSRGWLHPWWAYMLCGFGVAFLIEALIRMTRHMNRTPVGGKVVGGVALILVGSFFIRGIADWWAVALLIVGLAFLVRGIRKLRRRPEQP